MRLSLMSLIFHVIGSTSPWHIVHVLYISMYFISPFSVNNIFHEQLTMRRQINEGEVCVANIKILR